MSETPLRLRAVTPADRDLLFRWVNDPEVRRASFSDSPVERDEHDAWFDERLRDAESWLYVATTHAGEPVGQARFQLDEKGRAVISISIAPEWRGRGWAAEAIGLATTEFLRKTDADAVLAFIRPENEASLRAFRRAGYSNPLEVLYNGNPAVRVTFSPDSVS